MEMVRFECWATHNVCYNIGGYFSRALILHPTKWNVIVMVLLFGIWMPHVDYCTLHILYTNAIYTASFFFVSPLQNRSAADGDFEFGQVRK